MQKELTVELFAIFTQALKRAVKEIGRKADGKTAGKVQAVAVKKKPDKDGWVSA